MNDEWRPAETLIWHVNYFWNKMTLNLRCGSLIPSLNQPNSGTFWSCVRTTIVNNARDWQLSCGRAAGYMWLTVGLHVVARRATSVGPLVAKGRAPGPLKVLVMVWWTTRRRGYLDDERREEESSKEEMKLEIWNRTRGSSRSEGGEIKSLEGEQVIKGEGAGRSETCKSVPNIRLVIQSPT